MRVFDFLKPLFGSQRRVVLDTQRPIRARYDAAQDSNETKNIWSAADALDADASNSLGVRTKLRKRSRYERGNNGDCSGIIRTQANYVVGRGPTLRMQTGSTAYNAMVEGKWKRWCKKSKFAHKLRTMNRAKTGDGEAFALLVNNPGINDQVHLDLRLIECDQVTAPTGIADSKNYIDGIRYDDYATPIGYDVLDQHPGSSWYSSAVRGGQGYQTYPADKVCHWFGGDERPDQHRGIPELNPTLNLFATGRRYREAVVAAAETAADFTAFINMGTTQDGNDEVAPFTTLPIDKRTMVVTPAGATASQMKAEQPTTTYESFNRSQLREQARPLNMPYNIAACDSSGYSYSGGQLDHQTYFVSVDVEREDCETDVLDKVFAAWFREATSVYGWRGDGIAPEHSWAWTGKPHSDPTKIATARKIRLSCGDISPSECAAEDGVDFDDRVTSLATDYGVSEEEIRQKLFMSNFQSPGGGPQAPETGDDSEDKSEGETVGGEEEESDSEVPAAKGNNGVNRMAAMFGGSLS